MRTKPTQRSVERLRQIGIQPDILICRTERAIAKDDIDKIALFCNVEPRAVIEERDKEFSIYEVPVSLSEHRLDELIVEKLHLKAAPLDISDWTKMLHRLRNPEHEVTIGVVGKYIRHNDAYKSVYEAPVSLSDHGLDELIVEKLHVKAAPLDIPDWTKMLHRLRTPEHEVTIGAVGKSIRHNDAYKSVYEALDHAGISLATRVVLRK